MVNQKAISFKITFQNLENLDDSIRNSSHWTNRNAELNRAVEMYVEYVNARDELNTMGNPVPMQEFLHNHMSKTTIPKTYPAEVISFTRGDNLATIATNGMRHVSQEFECVKEHSSLKTAIAYLESKGYKIDTSNFQSI